MGYHYVARIQRPLVTPPDSSDNSPPLRARPFPAKIWQSWRDDAEDPTERTVGFPRAWRAANPGHRYERLTDGNAETWVRQAGFATSTEEEDSGGSGGVADLFAGLADPILRADLLRYLVMAREGGVWADVDVFPHRPIASWIPAGFRDHDNASSVSRSRSGSSRTVNLVVGIENDHHGQPIWPGQPYSVQLAQYVMLAKPGHPALEALVDQVCINLRALLESKEKKKQQKQKAAGDGQQQQQQHAKTTFEEVMATTGPFAFTRVLMEYFAEVTGTEHTGKELTKLRHPVLIGDVLVLPKDSFGWLPHEHTHEKGHPSILVEHLFMGSWRADHPG